MSPRIALLLLVLAGGLAAGEATPRPPRRRRPPLEMSLSSVYRFTRSMSPPAIHLAFANNTDKAIDGDMRYEIVRGGERAATVRGGSVYLPPATGEGRNFRPGKAAYTVVLPLPADNELDVRVTLVTEKKTWSLGSHRLLSRQAVARRLVLACCVPPTAVDEELDEILTRFRWSESDPRGNPASRPSRCATERVRCLPERLPAGVCGLLGMDICFLDDRIFDDLVSEQITALVTWVRAGGCLVIRGRRLSPALKETLGPLGIGDQRGNLKLGHQRYRLDFGRVLTVNRVGEEPDWDQWRADACWLWRFRADRRREIRGSGNHRWSSNAVQSQDYRHSSRQRNYHANVYGRSDNMNLDQILAAELDHNPYGNELAGLFKPKGVQLIEFEIIILILLIFLAAIGPAEYFALRALRQRRLTWVTFPLISLLFTGFTVWLAEKYMGGSDTHATLVICDVGDDGRPVRTSRYKQHYRSTTSSVHETIDQGIIDVVDMNLFEIHNTPGAYGGADFSKRPLNIEGSPLGRQRVEFVIPKWTPQSYRITTFGPQDSPPVEVAWDEIRGWLEGEKHRGKNLPEAMIEFGLGRHDRVIVYRGGQQGQSSPDPQAVSGSLYNLHMLHPNIIESLTVAKRQGVHALVHGLAPGGAGNYEDLLIHDPSDDGCTTVVVVHVEADEVWLVRRQFHREEG